tara:strand:+ start:485 stop:718 length:234 start_codon:yes stop_codon:yes gene_type:complete
MPNNDLTRDSYNPPGLNSDDWETFKFNDLEEMELFWLSTTKSKSNVPYRKTTPTHGMNTHTRESSVIDQKQVVYQRI